MNPNENLVNKYDLKNCPFCGSVGQGIRIDTAKHWTGMTNIIISATVIHWCNREEGQPQTCIQVMGATVEDAVKKWNTRG